MSHWAASCIGWPYELGAQGPGAWDCWSFFRHIQCAHYGRNVPLLPTPPTWRDIARAFPAWSARHGWHETAAPRDGDAVFMARLREPTHVGIWLADLQATLHCPAGGSVLHDARHLAAGQWRVRGYFSPKE